MQEREEEIKKIVEAKLAEASTLENISPSYSTKGAIVACSEILEAIRKK